MLYFRIENAEFTSRRVRIGEVLNFAFGLVSTSRKAQTLLVDFTVHFVKANGKSVPKVFKLKSVALDAGGRVTLEASMSFREMTMRRHYPGLHRIDVIVNGVAFSISSVTVD